MTRVHVRTAREVYGSNGFRPSGVRPSGFRPTLIVAVIGLCASLWVTSASAQDGSVQDPQVAEPKPWYRGVSQADRAQAGELFARGATLHKRKQFAEAIVEYRAALQHWDNPDIHFNLVQAHIELEQPLEAHASLVQATRYGLQHMTAKDRVRARDYQRLLEGHLVELTIDSQQVDVQVTLDDEVLFTGPGRDTRWVLPASHRIRATRAGYIDFDEQIEPVPGEPRSVAIELVSRSQLARVVVSCAEPEAQVTLDEQPLLECPGQTEKELMSEQTYAIAIERPGYLGEHRSVTPKPGERVAVDLRTTTIEVASSLRWSRALPLSVVAGGLALAVVGGVMQNQAVSNMSSYDSEIDSRCGPPIHGCFPGIVPQEVLDLETRAQWQNRMGIGMMLAGGVIVSAGLTLVLLNKPQGQRVEKPSKPARIVVPTISGKGGGVVAKFRF